MSYRIGDFPSKKVLFAASFTMQVVLPVRPFSTSKYSCYYEVGPNACY